MDMLLIKTSNMKRMKEKPTIKRVAVGGRVG